MIDTVWVEEDISQHRWRGMTRAIKHARPSHVVQLLARFYAPTEATKKDPARPARVEVLLSLPVTLTTEEPDELRRMAIVLNEAARWLELAGVGPW